MNPKREMHHITGARIQFQIGTYVRVIHKGVAQLSDRAAVPARVMEFQNRYLAGAQGDGPTCVRSWVGRWRSVKRPRRSAGEGYVEGDGPGGGPTEARGVGKSSTAWTVVRGTGGDGGVADAERL